LHDETERPQPPARRRRMFDGYFFVALVSHAGTAQIVAFATAWSLLSLNRYLVWEASLMGLAAGPAARYGCPRRWCWARWSMCSADQAAAATPRTRLPCASKW
jgi:hypothetical protein